MDPDTSCNTHDLLECPCNGLGQSGLSEVNDLDPLSKAKEDTDDSDSESETEKGFMAASQVKEETINKLDKAVSSATSLIARSTHKASVPQKEESRACCIRRVDTYRLPQTECAGRCSWRYPSKVDIRSREAGWKGCCNGLDAAQITTGYTSRCHRQACYRRSWRSIAEVECSWRPRRNCVIPVWKKLKADCYCWNRERGDFWELNIMTPWTGWFITLNRV